MTISISVQRLLQQVYALSALRSYAHYNLKEIPLIQPDHAEALAALAVDIFSEIALNLAPYLHSTVIPEDGGDILELVFNDDNAIGFSRPISLSVENAIVEKLLYLIFSDHDSYYAGENLRRSSRSVQMIENLITRKNLTGAPIRIYPCY